MAKPSKGKKSARADQKAGSDRAAMKEQEKQQPPKTIQAEVPKTDKPAPEKVEPAKQASIVDKAINFLTSRVTWYTVVLVILMAFMFYMRTMPAHDAVFTNWPWINGSTYVNVAEDDGVYHMRLLYNTLQHFPFRIMYDPFTHFPYGNTIHFGPLFELIPAAFLLIIGLGHPAQSLIDTVAAYYPAFLGMLVIIPVYYTGKKLFGRRAGLVAAVILAFLPGAFFWRSMLGSTDHHVAEVLFMASTVACLVYALDAAKGSKLSIEHLKNKDWNSVKMPLLYAALTGLFFGCYLLNWVGAMLLAFTLFIYFTLQAFVDHLKGRPLDYIPIMAAFVFLIPAAMVLPYSLGNPSFQAVYYSLTQPVILVFAFIAICVEYLISKTMQQGKVEKWAYPVSIIGISVIGLLFIYLAIPGLFGILNYGIGQLWPSGGTLTIGEAYPTFLERGTGKLTFSTVWYYFFWTFPASVLGLLLLAFRAAKKQRPADIMFLVWNLVMFWALIAQNRYTYYFALNVSLLTAYLAAEMFNAIGIDGLWAGFRKKVDGMESFQRFVKKNMGSCLAVAFVLLVFSFIAVYPVLPMSDLTAQGKEGALFQSAKSSPGMPYEWYDALMWMRSHTPDPQGSTVSSSFDYWSGQYYKSPSNKTYDYPSSAYGVMSWWDYGHMIEYIANRIPNANPFQAGIIEENGTTGASPFFCSTDEDRSVQMLDALGSRYVVIDNQMATSKFYAIQTWIGDTSGWETMTKSNLTYANMTSGLVYDVGEQVPTIVDTDKWKDSIMNRLYYGDASGMSHYRLVYESAGSYAFNFRYMQYDDQGQLVSAGMPESPMRIDNYTDALDRYDVLSKYVVAQNDMGTLYVYGARPPEKWVKIFEKVEGATLTGSAPDGSVVTATLTLKTDWGRTFNYTATTVVHNGTYSFVVPYPTEQMKGDGYSYGIMPQGEYTIAYGNTTKSVAVSESAVMSGATIQVS